MEQERHNNEMHVLKNEIQKWQDKNEMTVKDLQMRESALHRIEVELDCARTDLERAKLQNEKSESQHQLQVQLRHFEFPSKIAKSLNKAKVRPRLKL